MDFNLSNLPNFSIASIKNSLDEVRAQVYPKNETEKKVIVNIYISAGAALCNNINSSGL
jgi:hypothetical protein